MKTDDVNGATLETWTPEEVAEAMKKHEIVLVDVRTPQEYMFEHIEGALLMPMAYFDPLALPDGGDRQVVLHCGSGARSEKMARKAIAAGRGRIAHMGGGFGAWKKAELPHIATDMASGAPKKVND